MNPGEFCTVPLNAPDKILLAHGGGGRLSQQLMERIFLPAFANPKLEAHHDGAILEIDGKRLAFTTDSFVVHPLFFPGGDIGTLAVNGTVNDLAMCGARPLFLSAGFIIEEGFAETDLSRAVASMRAAAAEAKVEIVTGDTKVVDKGKGDGLFINTAGIGVIEHSQIIAPSNVRAGDAVLLSGDLGRHGIAIMAVREGLSFESTIESDCAPLWSMIESLLKTCANIHCMRDLTRGGLASALNEIAQASRTQIGIDESAIPVSDDVRGACEILGLDPLYVANEGRFICILPASDAESALAVLHKHPLGIDARLIGHVTGGEPGLVTVKTPLGTQRILDMLSGEQLPRIC